MSKRFDFVNGQMRHACEKGATFQGGLYIKDPYNQPIDLTGYSFKMQVRESETSSAILTITNSSYGTITAAQGKISWLVPNTVTDDFVAGEYLYDLELTSSGGIVKRIIEGRFQITAEMTQ